MKTITKEYTLYTFDELDQNAKDNAMNEYNKNNDFYFLSDDMNQRLHELLIENNIKDISKQNTNPTAVLYSLSYSQGDGAMFEGDFEWNGYNITIKHHGHYYHSYCKTIDITDEEGNEPETDEPLNTFEDIYQDICKKLEKYGYDQMEYESSEEYFAETCIANEYTFLKDGTMMNY